MDRNYKAPHHPEKCQYCPECGDDMTARHSRIKNIDYRDSRGIVRLGEKEYIDMWACSCTDRINARFSFAL